MKRVLVVALTIAAVFFMNVVPVLASMPDGAAKVRAQNSLAGLPLRFEKNEGQTSDEVKFLSRGNGYAMYFTPTESVMVLSRAAGSFSPEKKSLDPLQSMEPVKMETSVVRMEVVGANERATITGQDKLPGTSNYFKGNDQSKWRQGVANYKKVHYEEVYPGIDLVYYGNQKKLEYDFVVKPGADPKKIELNFKGTETLSIDNKGNLILETKTGNVVQRAPVIFQTIDGEKQSVEGKYVIKDNHNVAFQLAKYNPEHSLVIDPVIGFSTYLGGSSSESGYAIALDSAGNIYVAGYSFSPDFDVLNEIQGYTGGSAFFPGDAVVFKLEQSKSVPALAFSTFFGGSSAERAMGVAVDNSGNIYVTGYTNSFDFNVLNEIEGPTGADDVFVTKFEQSSNIPSIAFSTYLGGSATERSEDIVLDPTGNIYIAGSTFSTDFDLLNEIEGSSGFQDIFVTKLEQANNIPSLAFSTYLGGSFGESANAITLDSANSVYVTGSTSSSDFDVVNEIQGTNFSTDGILFKLEQNNNIPSLVFSTYLGGIGTDAGRGVAVDGSGNVFVAGLTKSPDFPILNEIEGDSPRDDIFLLKLEQSNNIFSVAYSTYLGGSENEQANDIALDASGNIFLTGVTDSPDFDVVNNIDVFGGNDDVFVAQLTETNNVPSLVFSTFLGGSGDDLGQSIALDGAGNPYITGFSVSPDFYKFNEIEGRTGQSDIIVSKILPGVSDTTAPSITAPANMTVEATDPLTPAPGNPIVSDDFTPLDRIIVTANPAELPVGTSIVTWTAEDFAGNQATAPTTQSVTVTDTTAPQVFIEGDNPLQWQHFEPYVDPWAFGFDLVDEAIVVSATSQPGPTPDTFVVTYSATDAAGNTGTAQRTVQIVGDITPPVITVLGPNPLVVPDGGTYVDPGATAVDNIDGPVEVTLTSVELFPGVYDAIYSATDSSGNTSTAARRIRVAPAQ